MKISATLIGRLDSFGRRTVAIRIADGASRRHQATHIRVKPDQFHRGMIKPTHPDHQLLNHRILEMIMQVQKDGGFKEKDVTTFNDYAEMLMKRWANTKAKDTLKHHRTAIKKFNTFRASVKLTDITPDLLQAYTDYCYNLGNDGNTVWNTLRFVRLIVMQALREEKIDRNPFLRFDMPKYIDPPKTYLTQKELKAIDKVRKDKSTPEEVRFAAAWFLIGCECGLRYGDMAAFDKKKNIKDGRLVVYTGKTGEAVGMRVEGRLKLLLEIVDYEPMVYSNVHFNRLLKILADMAGIDTRLTVHVSRHTFAMTLANKGASQELVGRLMGHRKLSTTGVYFKVSNKRIDDELKRLR